MSRPLFAAALLLLPFCAFAADEWKLHPDAAVVEANPKGVVHAMPPWESKIFAGTTREWSVYVPAQYQPDGSAAVMVIQDGHDYVRLNGNWRAPTVFDNLIAKGEMPVTVAIFINPGHDPSKPKPENAWKVSNRSYEYDSLGDRYARFLLEEILPEVEKQWPLSRDPEKRAICGASSGGICSFTVAWERPDQFRKVLSTIGSYTNIRGGNAYPGIIRKTERKPLRVFLEDSTGDVDNQFGNWPLANQQMYAALKYMGYDVKFDYVEGYSHGSKHGGSIFPDAVKWLWRAEKPKPEIVTKGDLAPDMTLHKLLIEGEDWQLVAENLGFADAPCADAEGNVYYCDMKAPAVFRVGPDGQAVKIASAAASGLEFGPDGRLYGCHGGTKRLLAIDVKTGEASTIATEVQPNDMAITKEGRIYFTETGKKQVSMYDPATKQTMAVDVGINGPNGIAISPDGSTLAVSDSKGANVWTFRIESDGKLTAKAPYMTMRLPIDPNGQFERQSPPPYQSASKGDGMIADKTGRWFVTSALGVQIFDPTGRLSGVVRPPNPGKPLTSCTLAGPEKSWLYATSGDKVFRRKVQAVGF